MNESWTCHHLAKRTETAAGAAPGRSRTKPMSRPPQMGQKTWPEVTVRQVEPACTSAAQGYSRGEPGSGAPIRCAILNAAEATPQ